MKKMGIISLFCIVTVCNCVERFDDAVSKRLAIAGFTLPGAYQGPINDETQYKKLLKEQQLASPRAARRRRGSLDGHRKKVRSCQKGCSVFCTA